MPCILHCGYNSTCPVCSHQARKTLRDDFIEQAPIVSKFDNGAVFKGAGHSHFTVDNNRFHETTEVPGLNQGFPIKIRTDL